MSLALFFTCTICSVCNDKPKVGCAELFGLCSRFIQRMDSASTNRTPFLGLKYMSEYFWEMFTACVLMSIPCPTSVGGQGFWSAINATFDDLIAVVRVWG